ncbi:MULTISPECIES: tetratricopeptide repeat protein [unclassified Listeria]|uniref:tetratricopeptide repeat protein n=1 Tax=unclassified Listeria TaxID=2642072 RepID=UPI000B58FFE5|nr:MULTISPECIES: tetratricopeptide repeat protein [unclassified Listeria]
MNKLLEEALGDRENGNLKKSNQLLLKLLETEPENPYVLYQVAWSFDVLEKEEEAIAFYEKAIQNGLSGADLAEAYLGLGSTYRALGKYDVAEEVIRKGRQQFPNNYALSVFYAMVLHNLERHSESAEILLHLLAETSSDEAIIAYKKAIVFYADKLDRVWK